MNPLNTLFRIIGILICIEIFVMELFRYLAIPDGWWRSIGDAFLLGLLSTPFIYYLIITPMKQRQRLESDKKELHMVIAVLSSAVSRRDTPISRHQNKTANLARSIAQEMGLNHDQVEGARIAATLHDVGNIWIPARIFAKPGKLNSAEFDIVKQHSQYSFDILKNIEFPWPVAEVVYQHHERMDGSGYPRGLKGDEICLKARILAVADTVSAMTTHRPDRAAFAIDEALETVKKKRGKEFDAVVVDACLSLFSRGYSFNDAATGN